MTCITSLMHTRVQTVDAASSVAEVEALFISGQVSCVPVTCGNGGVIGVISSTDMMRFHATRYDAASTRAGQLCSHRPIVVKPQATLAEVAAEMVARRIHHAVVAEGRRVLGVVSSLDFVSRFRAQAVAAAGAAGGSGACEPGKASGVAQA